MAELRSKTVFITGGSGLVGSHLAEALVAEGARLRCLVRASSDTAILKRLGAELVEGDVTDPPEKLRQLMAGSEVVFHCAAMVDDWASLEAMTRVNVDGVHNMLEAVAAAARAETVSFTLLTHPDNNLILPQPKGLVGISGDHLPRTSDDITGSTFNPQGAFTFNFVSPMGVWMPDSPPGYAERIHSMTGTFILDSNLWTGGSVSLSSLTFDGYVSPGKYSAQRLVCPADTATNGNYGSVDGQPNSGSYAASAAANWAFQLSFDWFFDTPYAGSGTIDVTFNNYRWDGFIIPASQLTPAGLDLVTLNDSLGFFSGTSPDFEAWLLSEVKPRLPADATWLLFAQGTANPAWTNPSMGMTTDALVDQTILAYATIPEPATGAMLLAGASYLLANKRRR